MGVKRLNNLTYGDKGTIVRVRGKATIHRYLLGLGLFVGRMISVEKAGLPMFGEYVRVKVNSSVFDVEETVAGNIQVEVNKR